jgi:hypothetical protein
VSSPTAAPSVPLFVEELYASLPEIFQKEIIILKADPFPLSVIFLLV